MSRSPGLVAAALLTLASCYSWIGRYPEGLKTSGQKPYVDSYGQRHWYVDVAARNVVVREKYAQELFSCAPVKPLISPRAGLRPINRPGQPRPVTPGDAAAGDLVFRVGFISDVHIRQPSVKLFNDELSRDFDHIINSFERNGYEEAFANAVYAATISAFNELSSPADKPRLVINTGDATDAGTIEEAYDFAALSHHLRYPMLYALGNHDDAIFGNYKNDLGYTKDASPSFYPTGEKARFLKFFNRTRRIDGFSDELIPLPGGYPNAQINARWGVLDLARENEPGAEPEEPQTCVTAPERCKQRTYCRGFDLYGPKVGDGKNCDTYPGYYAVTLPGNSGTRVQLISLNTTRETTWGEGADFPAAQRDWLVKELLSPATVTIVFSHHRPTEVPGLMPLLDATAAQRPLIYLSGHSHSHATEWRGRFWELNTGSLEEFPQWARLVEVRRAGDGRFYLNARILRPRLPLRERPGVELGGRPAPPADYWDQLRPDVKPQMQAWFEARFADCDRIAALPPGQCARGSGVGSLLTESAQCGYLGALYDHLFPPKGQSAIYAATQADVVLDISAR